MPAEGRPSNEDPADARHPGGEDWQGPTVQTLPEIVALPGRCRHREQLRPSGSALTGQRRVGLDTRGRLQSFYTALRTFYNPITAG